MTAPRRSGWCAIDAAPWQHARCHLEGCSCDCHLLDTVVEQLDILVEPSIVPYYADDRVALYHGRFEDLLPQLGVQADLLVADPPYGETALEWGRWPTGWPSVAATFGRSLWCYGSMRMIIDRVQEFSDWRFSQDFVWEKHNGSGLAKDRFKRVHEFATFWYQGPWSEIYHEVPTTADATPRAVRRKAKPVHHQGARGPSYYVSEDGGPRLMRSVFYHPSMHGKAINETEKPVLVTTPLLQYGCRPGGLVVDLFAGSCSTLVAAAQLGMRAIGFEVREEQCEKAARRLAAGVQLTIDGGVA